MTGSAIGLPDPPPAALRFAAVCCAASHREGFEGQVRDAAAEADWPLMLRLFARHRIEGLAWKGLARSGVLPPPEEAAALEAAAQKIAAGNMAVAAEMARLDAALGASGIDRIFVKGLTLAKLAYGNVLTKSAWDIDLLVAPASVGQASTLLRDLGYDPLIPRDVRTQSKIIRWHRRHKESVWFNRARRMTVELHSALADDAALIRDIGLTSPRQQVELASGVVVATLEQTELLAYLTVHGASSAWFRIKWVADFAALVGGMEPVELDNLHRDFERLGTGRAGGLALLLRQWLFGVELGPSLARRLSSDPAQRWLFRTAARAMTGRRMLEEPTSFRFGTLPIHALQYRIVPGARGKLSRLYSNVTGVFRTSH